MRKAHKRHDSNLALLLILFLALLPVKYGTSLKQAPVAMEQDDEDTQPKAAVASTPSVPTPVQTVTIRLNSNSFDDSFLTDVSRMSFPSREKVPKKRVVVPIPQKKKTWAELTNGSERWAFIERYTNEYGYVCKSGKTKREEIAELEKSYPWALIYGYIVTYCSQKVPVQTASAPGN